MKNSNITRLLQILVHTKSLKNLQVLGFFITIKILIKCEKKFDVNLNVINIETVKIIESRSLRWYGKGIIQIPFIVLGGIFR